jgi:hypothetical protein
MSRSFDCFLILYDLRSTAPAFVHTMLYMDDRGQVLVVRMYADLSLYLCGTSPQIYI